MTLDLFVKLKYDSTSLKHYNIITW